MQSHSHESDVSNMVEIAQKNVVEKPLREAIFAMAIGHNPIDTNALRARVLKQIDEFPLSSLFDMTMMDSDGRVIAHKQSVFNAIEENKAAARNIRRMNRISGNLIHLAQNGEFDLIVNGCNCFCTMGAGIAKGIKAAFPHAYAADLTTSRGDRTKLGTCTFAEINQNGIPSEVSLFGHEDTGRV